MTDMAKYRRILMWVTLAGLVGLAQLAALSAFVGHEKAWVLFNSVPLMLAWVALLVLLVVGFKVYPSLLRRPGLLVVHLGCVLILAGGIWGSKLGVKLADTWSPRKRVYKGYMLRLYDGQSSTDVTDATGRHFDELPFEVASEKFRIAYYPYPNKLSVVVSKAVKTGRWRGGQQKEEQEDDVKRFKWTLNEWRDLPFSDDIQIRVTAFRIQPPVVTPFLLGEAPAHTGHAHEASDQVIPIRTGPEVGEFFEVTAGHPGTLMGRIRRTYRSYWEPHPMLPGQMREAEGEGPGSRAAAEIDLFVRRGTTYVYTKEIIDALGEKGSMAPVRYVPQDQARQETGKDQAGPVIIAEPPGLEKEIVPAKVGAEFTFMPGRRGQGVLARVRRLCFVRLSGQADSPEGRTVAEAAAGEAGAQPAAEIDLLTPRNTVRAYTPGVTADLARGGGRETMFTYVPPDDADKMTGMQRPVITFQARRGSRQAERTITIVKARESGAVRLDFLYGNHDEWLKGGAPRVFAADAPPIKEYTSDLVIREEGKVVARKTIEVNHPLHYGGYHFYQSSYDKDDLAYTSITIKSDAGWAVVLTGMVLLMLGAFIHFWFAPVWRAARRRGQSARHAGAAGPDPAARGKVNA